MSRTIAFLLLAFPAVASAQMIRGTVTDAATNAPINAANVTLFTSDGRRAGKMVSDEDGMFELVLPKGKTVYVQAERVGYKSAKSDPITATAAELLELTIHMSTEVLPLRGIEVVARRQVDPRLREFLDRASLYKRAGIGHIWTRAELERRPLALVSHMLGWVPRRPGFNCQGMSVFIDDMPVDAQDMDLLVAPEDLEGAELYDEMSVPPDLLYKSQMSIGRIGSNAPPCQTMMLWRKPYAELNAFYAAHPVKAWRAVLGAVLLGGLLATEELLMRR